MDGKKTFDRYYSHLAREGALKALLGGLIAGFAVDFIVAFITWFTPVNGLWIAVGAGVFAAAVTAPVLYFKKFRPTAKKIARRVDRLGLEERLITMTELENDESYIALRQREDAMEKLQRVKTKEIRFQISKALLCVAVCVCILGVGMTAVTALSAAGIVPPGTEVFPPDPFEPVEYIEVNYVVEDVAYGYIEGEAEQLIPRGENATPVLAVAEDGWAFQEWSDGYPDPAREDLDIREPLTVTAIFQPVDENGEQSDQQPSDPGDQPENQPNESASSPPGDPSQNPERPNEKYEENNQIVDGETYYRDLYEDYLAQALEYLESGEEIPPELREIIEEYLEILK